MKSTSKKTRLAVSDRQIAPTASPAAKSLPGETQGSGKQVAAHPATKKKRAPQSAKKPDDGYCLGLVEGLPSATADMKATGEPANQQDSVRWKEQVAPLLPVGKSTTITTLSWNTKALSRRLPQLRKLACDKKPTFIVITESSLRSHQSTPRITGYPNPIRSDRADNRQNQGGGIIYTYIFQNPFWSSAP